MRRLEEKVEVLLDVGCDNVYNIVSFLLGQKPHAWKWRFVDCVHISMQNETQQCFVKK